MKKIIAMALVVAGMSTGTAHAGSPIYGYGNSRAGAAADATRAVKEASVERFNRSDCYTPVRPENCREDGNGWVCIAYVANHAGSCGS